MRRELEQSLMIAPRWKDENASRRGRFPSQLLWKSWLMSGKMENSDADREVRGSVWNWLRRDTTNPGGICGFMSMFARDEVDVGEAGGGRPRSAESRVPRSRAKEVLTDAGRRDDARRPTPGSSVLLFRVVADDSGVLD